MSVRVRGGAVKGVRVVLADQKGVYDGARIRSGGLACQPSADTAEAEANVVDSDAMWDEQQPVPGSKRARRPKLGGATQPEGTSFVTTTALRGQDTSPTMVFPESIHYRRLRRSRRRDEWQPA